jgi:NitT/TauT family transport system substrate-binding protein
MVTTRRAVVLGVLAVGLVTVLLLLALNQSNRRPMTAEEWPVVRIGYLPIAAELPLFVAIEEGFFTDEGLEFELARFTSSNELGNAATADQVDVMAGTASNVVFDLFNVSQKRHHLLAINPYSDRPGHVTDHLIVRRDSGITELSQLRGKRIASFPGSVNRIFVNLILEKYGVPRQSYEYLEMAPPNWQPALQAGSIDAVSALEPNATQILEDKIGVSIFPGFYADLMEEVPLSGHWIASGFYDRSDPIQLDALVRVYARAIEFCRESPSQARAYLTKYANVRADIVDDVGLNPWRMVHDVSPQRFQEYIDLLAENEAVLRRVDGDLFLQLATRSVD